MINHVRSMLLWTHPAKLAAESPRYHLVPHGFSTPPLPPSLSALKRALVPYAYEDLDLLYDRVDALLVCCHSPELDPFTRIHDNRLTYSVPVPADAWLDGHRLAVTVHRDAAAADLGITIRRVAASDAAPGTRRSWLVRRVSATQTLSIEAATGAGFNRNCVFGSGTATVKLSPDLALVITSPTGLLVGEFSVAVSDRMPASVDVPALSSAVSDLALAAYNEALGSPIQHQAHLDRLARLLRGDQPPHIVLGIAALVFAYLASAVWEAAT